MGPLLFIIALKDLPQAVSSTTSIFADDTLLYDSSCSTGSDDCTSACCKLQNDLGSLTQWSKIHDTTFNAAKSLHMIFRRKKTSPSEPTLYLDGEKVPFQVHTKHLGVTLTSSLEWSRHVHDLLQRTHFKLFALKRLAYRCGANSFVKKLFTALVRPVFEYASPVWESCGKSLAISLERAQLAVARAILRYSRKKHSNREVLNAIGWPTLAWRRRRYKLLLFWRLLNGEGPPTLRKRIPAFASERANYSFRKAKSVSFPWCSTSRRLHSFIPSAILLWNSLPSSVTDAVSSCSFLSQLDRHFSSDKFSFGLP